MLCRIRPLSIGELSLQKIGFQRVARFLSSIERNSLKSRYAYQNGLIHLKGFLSQKYPDYDLDIIRG
jgi:hypothetical protein